MLYLYLVAAQPAAGSVASAPDVVGDAGGGGGRRGGLLHEMRYYARLAAEAREAERASRAQIRQVRSRTTPRPANVAAAVSERAPGPLAHSEDDETVILAYLAAYW